MKKNDVLLMAINPDLQGCSVDIHSVKGLTVAKVDTDCDADCEDLKDRLKDHARHLGGNAVIDIRMYKDGYDTIAYGTAVKFTQDELNGTILKKNSK